MNLTWEAYKQAEAKKPQSQLLDKWHKPTNLSEFDEPPPEELVRILEANPQANVFKLKLQFWEQIKASRKEELEREFFNLRQACVSCSGH